jgi:prevent-host-death family protein
MKKWQLQEAKNRLSELVRRAADEGPQVITLRGDDAVVVVGAQEYRELTARSKGDLVDFFRNSPLAKVKLDLSRSRGTGRDVDL